MGSAWVEGGGGQETQSQPASYQVWGGGGGGEVRVTVLALNAARMHVDLSFSYLRSAATASFDKKEFHRNCTICMAKLVDNVCSANMEN
jgi:hypothetical protein